RSQISISDRMWTPNEKRDKMVSGGPWLIGSYGPGGRLVLKRNPAFGEWNKDEAGNPFPSRDRYEIKIVKDVNAQLAEFLAANIDLMAPATVDHISQIRQAIRQGRLDATIKVTASPVARSEFMIKNWNKASDPFKQGLSRWNIFRRA
ncbi:ABC transporter substrate-binding protein, partial [Thermus scotoductus]|uniref:ABC transporter substrate-binding protein n=1 Tax=Thermus scotoductus TaxID=37636 RepID=UPI0020A32D28